MAITSFLIILVSLRPKNMKLNIITTHYRQHLARMIKQSTRNDYSKRLEMLERFASMHGISSIEDLDFFQFLDWVYIERNVRDQARHSSVAVTNKYLQGRDRPVHKETIRFKGAL